MTGSEAAKSSEAQSFSISKTYDPILEEPLIQKFWADRDVYKFGKDDRQKQTYSIDTPPPYPSGDFHVGNALNWCYFDFVARFHRMKGFNVHFPQGWDCHGLPTEVRAEQTHKIRKNDIPPAKFVELCRALTLEYIEKMKRTMISLGISTDWSLEYKTMDPEYYRLTQLSFVRLYKKGELYRGEHPVNWCPRCETAIAEAEVEHQERKGNLYQMIFQLDEGTLEIASTRPELLSSCVAVLVHPQDTRYTRIVGKKAKVPLFGQLVPIIADQEVDTSFGTGAVMVCTFGDKMDVKWQKRYSLPLIRAIGENGRLIVDDPRFRGLRTEEARKRIFEQLTNREEIVKAEPHVQNVGVCWRCKTAVEIVSRPQWFMKTMRMTEAVIKTAETLKWKPEFARTRLVDWANSLDWDWVISRQRIFATPIPVWYCQDCNETIIPSENQLPVDPRHDRPPSPSCPQCRGNRLLGENDVLDTWMDSSITAAVHAGWPDLEGNFQRLFPADLQPNGLDIVRTWDYYLLVRSLALFERAPYKALLINGMVRGTDGRMMHKSYGNYVDSGEAIAKYGADPLRQWAASGGSTGSDVPFRWTEMDHGKKFLTKLWNVARFVLSKIETGAPNDEKDNLLLIDRWILSRLQDLIRETTGHFEEYDFNLALEKVRDFIWHTLADDYLEAVKYRLEPGIEDSHRAGAQYTLYHVLTTVCKLLAPICPHITEAIFQQIPKTDHGQQSIHATQWPTVDPHRRSEAALSEGKTLIEAIALARRRKADNGISLKAPIRTLEISGNPSQLRVLQDNEKVILRTVKAEKLILSAGTELKAQTSSS